ncbi:RFC checkpoint protein Rad17 [Coemansia sp. RSA 1358]|nr:RFC checkpoint protein Rad17 [Coemansia sp. RSA 1358]
MTPKTRAQSKQDIAGDSVSVVFSPKSAAVGSTNAHTSSKITSGSNNEYDEFDIDLEMDSDLEALINECSQSTDSQELRPVTMAAPTQSLHSSQKSNGSHGNGRRRAISDRPNFKLARSNSQAQHVLRPPEAAKCTSDLVNDSADDRGEVWWQRYEPCSVEELALHSAKIAQVKGWLEMAINAAAGTDSSQGPSIFRILVLEGPPGACKSTCVRVLAKELELDIVEWINPLDLRASTAAQLEMEDDPVSIVRQFEDFLLRAEKYSGLALYDTADRHDAEEAKRLAFSRHKIILVDDLPNILHRDTRESFRVALQRFISIPAHCSFPMVIVVSECFGMQQVLEDEAPRQRGRRLHDNAESNAEATVWSASDVIPSVVYNSVFCHSIKFNPVAPTIATKGLRRILQLRSGRGSQKSIKLAQQQTDMIKAISNECQGDFRLAVTMLQLSQAAAENTDAGKKRRRGQAGAVTGIIDNNGKQRAGGACRSALDMFHALGKVLYAKREATKSSNGVSADGNMMREKLESDPDEILDRLPVDLSTFGLFVHENYTDFCSGIDEAAAAAEYFSEGDALSSSGRSFQSAASGVANVYGSMVSVRGYMNARGNPLYAGDGTTNEPAGGRRWSMAAFRKPLFFESYKRRAMFGGVWHDPVATDILSKSGLPMALSSASRQTVVQDVLPYWAQIVSSSQHGAATVGSLESSWLRNSAAYNQLMRLATIGDNREGTHNDTSSAMAGKWGKLVTVERGLATHSPLTATAAAAAAAAATATATDALAELKLVLSDDDIEDFSD